MEKDLVEYIARAIVTKPDEVTVRVVEGEQSTIIELGVAEEDMGKIIGQGGRIAKSIRTILAVASFRSGRRVLLEIID